MRRQVAGYDAGSLPVASTANVMRVNVNPKQPLRLLTVSRPARPLKVVGDVERPATPLAEGSPVTGERSVHGVWRSRFFLPSDGGRRRPVTTPRCIVTQPRTLMCKVHRDSCSGGSLRRNATVSTGTARRVVWGAAPWWQREPIAHFFPASAVPFKARWTARAARSGSGLARGPLPRVPGETPPPPGVLRLAASFPTIRDPQRRQPARHPRRQTSARRQAQ